MGDKKLGDAAVGDDHVAIERYQPRTSSSIMMGAASAPYKTAADTMACFARYADAHDTAAAHHR